MWIDTCRGGTTRSELFSNPTFMGHTPETITRTQSRIDGLKMQIAADNQMVEKLQTQMIQTIEALNDWRIQEILTRRYVNNESFEAIAEAMHYDIRWIYRLHQQGLELTNPLGAA